MFSSSSLSRAPEFRNSDSHRRASVACKVCHSRKVRCNISPNGGWPCNNCQKDGHICVPHVSQRGKARHRSRSTAQSESIVEQASSFEESSAPLRTTDGSEADTASVSVGGGRRHDENPRAPSSTTATTSMMDVDKPFNSGVSTTTAASASSTAEEDCRSNIEGYKNIFTGALAQHDSRVVLFMGESQGIRSLFHACGDEALASNSHFWVPRVESAPLPPEDYAFLNAKGAFSLPPSPVCWELIDKYFRRVHPLLPAVDPVAFLTTYERNGLRGLSVLLLQCMFFAACNFIAPEVVRQAGAPSAKAMKKQFYLRAKALFELDYEKNKTTLIQSTLLMGYWFGMSYDRTDGWHWTSTAVSFAQTVGIHRNPTRLNVPDRQRNVWKRLWWCIVYRDRFTSLGMGRPLRIRLADCDLEVLTPADLTASDPASLGLSEKSRAIVEHCNLAAPVFAEVVKLSILLGEVLECQFSVERKETILEDIGQCEAKLSHWYDNLHPSLRIDLSRPLGDDAMSSVLVYKYILHLYFQLVTITLKRPLLYRTSNEVSLYGARDKAKVMSSIAAAASMEILRRIVDQDMIKWLPPEIVTVINSLIVICFLEKTWSDGGLKKHIATDKIELCLTILRELSERYWAASFFLSYFEAAFERAESLSSTMAKPSTINNNNHANSDNTINERTAPVVSGRGRELSPSAHEGRDMVSMSLSDSSTAVDGLTGTMGPGQVHYQQGYEGLPPTNFCEDFTEDFQQVGDIDFGFGSILDWP